MHYTIVGILFIIMSIIYANKYPENPYSPINLIFIVLGLLFLIVGHWSGRIAFNIGKMIGG